MAKNREKRRDKFLRARDESKVVQLFKKSQSLKKKGADIDKVEVFTL